MRSVELFAGAGGMAIGMANAGFHHAAVIEWDHDACETFRENQRRQNHSVEEWPLYEGDVRSFDYGKLQREEVVVVSGGPPCQPFSLGGKHRGYLDRRDMFPEAVRAVRELRPKAFIFENVKGLLRQSFASYFEYVHLQLTHPNLVRRKSESWFEHRARLEQHHTSRRVRSEYNVVFRLLNAANYGVPQKRERVFLVGFRSDLGIEWSFPEPSHSEDALLCSKWITGEYWDRHCVARKQRPQLALRQKARIESLRRGNLFRDGKSPWLTVRDAISDLPNP
jgi:DNA (cytosine-5)-methyltransferase 1